MLIRWLTAYLLAVGRKIPLIDRDLNPVDYSGKGTSEKRNFAIRD
jgi:hypothetical protein